MRKMTIGVLVAGIAAAAGAEARWVYCSRGLGNAADVAYVTNVVARAAGGGANGLLYAAGLDSYWKWSEEHKARFQQVRAFCAEKGVEVIPLLWSPGYGSLRGARPDTVETRLLTNIPHVARKGKICFEPQENLAYKNAGFETFDAQHGRFPDWMTETPGVVSFRDTEVKHGGAASVRLEPGKDGKHQARVVQKIRVKPNRRYKFSMWIRYQNIAKVFAPLKVEVYSDKKAPCGFTGVNVPRSADGNSDWQKVTCEIVSDETASLSVWMGTWRLSSGTFWIDDVAIEEIGLREVSGREGTPFVVRNAETGEVYRDYIDYLKPRAAREGANVVSRDRDLAFEIPSGSAIKEGTRLLVDAYVPSCNGGKQQRSICMSDAHVYDLVAASARGVWEACAPTKWFLSLDEVRNFNSCDLCKARQTTGGALLGEYTARVMAIIRQVSPAAEVYGWADMFDPNHNGKGEFADAWQGVPKDFVMCVWNERTRAESFKFFADKGFPVIGSMCKDGAHSIGKARGWLKDLAQYPTARGLIFTTWVGDYECVEEFGSLKGE